MGAGAGGRSRAAVGRAPGAGAGRRLRAGPRPGRPLGPAAVAGARGRPEGPGRGRSRAGAGAAAGIRPLAGLRPLPRTGRCAHCAGPLGISPRPGPGGARIPPAAGARPAATFDRPHCHGTKLRAPWWGSRTAEAGAGVPGRDGADVREHERGAGDGAGRAVARRRHPRRSRWPRAGTGRRCCSTRGRCWAAPTCARGGDDAALAQRRRWCGPPRPAGR